jgi:hypothetical protein
MRVFIGPMEVAGLGAGWVKGLRAIGISADLVCAYRHPFAYSDEAPPGLPARVWARWGSWRVTAAQEAPAKSVAIRCSS